MTSDSICSGVICEVAVLNVMLIPVGGYTWVHEENDFHYLEHAVC